MTVARVPPPFVVQQQGLPEQLSQTGLAATVDALRKTPLSNGLDVASVKLKAAAPTPVAHGLGRKPLGWMVTDLGVIAVVYRTDWDAKNITLATSNDCTVNLRVW